jgi:hypothetical protein
MHYTLSALAPGIGNGDVVLLSLLVGVGGSLLIVCTNAFRTLAKKVEQNGQLCIADLTLAKQAHCGWWIGMILIIFGLSFVLILAYRMFIRS